MCIVVENWLSKKWCKFIKTFFSSLNIHMHIFNMSVTYMQSNKRIHKRLKEELISQSMHDHPLIYMYSGQELATLKWCKFIKNYFFIIKLPHALFIMSVIYLQSIKRIHQNLYEELISQSMHYQPYCKHHTVITTKWHNSCNTDPSALFPYTLYQTCIVKWSRCGSNLIKIGQKLHKLLNKILEMLMEGRMTDGLKTVTTPLNYVCGGILIVSNS